MCLTEAHLLNCATFLTELKVHFLMTVRRAFLTLAVAVCIFALYFAVQPLGPGYEQLDRSSYSATAIGINAENQWSEFVDDKQGILFVHPGEIEPVLVKLRFASSGNAVLTFFIREGGQLGNIKFTLRHNGELIGSHEVIYDHSPTTVGLKIASGDIVEIEAEKNGITAQDWGQIRIEQRSAIFTLEEVLVPLLWAFLAFYLASKRHLTVVVNAYLIFLIYIVADKLTFGLLDFRNISAYSALAISLTFIFVWVYQELYWARRFRLAAALSFFLALILYVVPVTYIIYYLNFHESIDKSILFAIFQTNLTETIEYLHDFVSPLWLWGAMITALAIGFLLLSHEKRVPTVFERSLLLFLIVTFAVPTLISVDALRLPHFTFRTAAEYHRELSAFRAIQESRAAGIDNLTAAKDHNDEIHIVVIGESLNRRHMGLYGYFRETTPSLTRLRKSGELIVYENAFSSHTHTMQVLSQALTEANQFNHRSYFESSSLIDVLKAADVNTVWLTNQNLLGAWDNMVSVIANTADQLVGINRAIGTTVATDTWDAELLPPIADALHPKTKQSQVIFVHLMGSHSNYCSRFPEEYQDYTEPLPRGIAGSSIDHQPKLAQSLNCYDNSVLYNDYVVNRIISLLRESGTVGSVTYFSDHGDDVMAQLGHNSTKFTFDMAAIPLMFWLSDSYIERYPLKYKYLNQHSAKLFTNDLLFDTLLGVIDVRSDKRQEKFDLSSEAFHLEESKASTLHGKIPLFNDANYIWWQRFNRESLADIEQDERVIPHRVNSIGKLHDIWAAGYRSFEVDVIFNLNESSGFRIGHESATSGLPFEAYLDSINVSEVRKIWFDLKNLTAENYQEVLAALQSLDDRYALKDRLILESSTTGDWFKIFREEGWHTSYYTPTDRIVELLARNNISELNELAQQIAAQVEVQNVAAVSFDHRGYSFIKQYLESKLAKDVVYHSWVGPAISTSEFLKKLSQTPIYLDKRVRTVLIPFHSPFHL